MSSWKEKWCVCTKGLLKKGQKYLVREYGTRTLEIKLRGNVLYESPDLFSYQKPPEDRVEEDDYEEFC